MTERSLKSLLYQKCLEYALQRIENSAQAMENARSSANEDSKSSAGDKHETARAMAQLEQEKNASSLKEAQELKNTLVRIDQFSNTEIAIPGSLVITDKGNFYLSIGAGKLIIEDKVFFAVSSVSPIGKVILGKRIGEKFRMNNLDYSIEAML